MLVYHSISCMKWPVITTCAGGGTMVASVTAVLRRFKTSVHEMSSEAKWHETMVAGCKGPSVYGRNLGTCARCSNVLPRQEDPPGSARCGDQYSGRRASAPGADAVC